MAVLPLGPVGLGDSPYASPSAFAGNPLLISLDWLAGDGLLDRSKLEGAPSFDSSRVDYAAVRAYKDPLLREAFDAFVAAPARTCAAISTRFVQTRISGWPTSRSFWPCERPMAVRSGVPAERDRSASTGGARDRTPIARR